MLVEFVPFTQCICSKRPCCRHLSHSRGSPSECMLMNRCALADVTTQDGGSVCDVFFFFKYYACFVLSSLDQGGCHPFVIDASSTVRTAFALKLLRNPSLICTVIFRWIRSVMKLHVSIHILTQTFSNLNEKPNGL